VIITTLFIISGTTNVAADEVNETNPVDMESFVYSLPPFADANVLVTGNPAVLSTSPYTQWRVVIDNHESVKVRTDCHYLNNYGPPGGMDTGYHYFSMDATYSDQWGDPIHKFEYLEIYTQGEENEWDEISVTFTNCLKGGQIAVTWYVSATNLFQQAFDEDEYYGVIYIA